MADQNLIRPQWGRPAPRAGEMTKASCPQETIHWPQLRSPNGTLKYDELMAEHEILSKEGLGRPKGGEGQTDNEKNQLHSLPRNWRLDGLQATGRYRTQRSRSTQKPIRHRL